MKKLTTEIINERIKKLTNNEYEIDGEYTLRKAPIKIRHKKCGKSYTYKLLDNFLGKKDKKGRRCPYCEGRVIKLTQEYIDTILKEKYLNEYELESFNNNQLTLKDKKCNNTFVISKTRFVHSKNKNICPICHGFSKNRDIEEFKKQFIQKFPDDNDRITILSKSIGKTHEKIKVRCNLCKNEYFVSPTNLLSGKKCPYCNKTKTFSYQEKEILDFIKTFYTKKIIENDRTVLEGKELDLYFPEDKVAIEYDGLYWHGENNNPNKKYHLNKTNSCEKKSIHLIHIFENEWVNKKEIIKDKIKYILKGSYNLPKIYARKCIIKEINNDEKKKFLNYNHIQGSDRSSVKLGLFYKNTLVSVMTFCKPRISLGQKEKKFDYELSRFANSINYIVLGSFGKLFNYFSKNYSWNSIITYADRRFSTLINQNNIYCKNNFKFDHYSTISYWYFKVNDESKFYHRYTFKKQNLTKYKNYNKDKTEYQIMKENSYDRIWDCGNLVYYIYR